MPDRLSVAEVKPRPRALLLLIYLPRYLTVVDVDAEVGVV